MSGLKIDQLGQATPVMVFDVESVGLHGEGFAVGFVVIKGGMEVDSGAFGCPQSYALDDAGNLPPHVSSDRQWVGENVPDVGALGSPFVVRERFWNVWSTWKSKGAVLAADCAWPVEGRFLNACVDIATDLRRWDGPYPLIEISTLLLAAGFDPMASFPRGENELPMHHPLADARQSARLMMMAIDKLKGAD